MEFVTTKNPEAALTLIPWYVPFDQSREDIYLELRERLENTPEETFVGLLIEDDKLKLMAIAYCRYKDVFIWQARKLADVSSEMVDKVFEIVKKWTIEQGFNKISAIPNRSYRAFLRRWGFQKSDNNEIYLEL